MQENLPTEDIVRSDGFLYPELKRMILHILKVAPECSIFIQGSPGIGKSTLVHEVARELGFKKIIVLRLSQIEPSELAGGPALDHQKKVYRWYMPEFLEGVIEGDDNAEPAFIFLDEINAAITKLHQAAAYELVLEHRIRKWHLKKGSVVIAAGNTLEDEALAVPLSSALINRFWVAKLKPDPKQWLEDFAAPNNISPDIRAYIAWKGIRALCHRPTSTGPYATPRAWHFCSIVAHERMLEGLKGEERKKMENYRKHLMAGFIGEAEAIEFLAFSRTYSRVDTAAIVEQGKIPDLKNASVDFIYATVFAVAGYISDKELTDKQIENLSKLFNDAAVSLEMYAIFLKQVPSRMRSKISLHPAFKELSSRLGRTLLEIPEDKSHKKR